jgi:FtsZ-binding cell division protein ZapB
MANKKKNVNNVVEKEVVEDAVVNKTYSEKDVKELNDKVSSLQQEKEELKKQVEELKKQSNNIKKEFVVVLRKSNVNADYRVNGFNITLQNFNQVKEKGVNLPNISNYGLLMDVEEYKKKIKDDKNVINYADFMFVSF